MIKTKTYYNDSPLGYGFILNNQGSTSPAVRDICSKATSSITIVDTGDYVLDSFLYECTDLLNDKKVVVAGLVDKKTLASLKGKGVNTGFFRATNETLRLGLIIIDKKEVWACFGKGRIYRIAKGSEEIFQYVNHLLWTKTDNEYSFGESRLVQETMLSVVMPVPSIGAGVDSTQHDYASTGMPSNKGVLAKEFGDYNRPSIVMPLDCKAYLNGDRLFVEILPNAFYEVANAKELELAFSFEEGRSLPNDLLGKRIFYKGKEYQVVENESISETVAVPLDELNTYEPDFDRFYAKREQISAKTEVHVEITPMRSDETYQRSQNYKNRKQIDERIASGLESLEKLSLGKDVDKKIKSVRSETVFEEKVRLYNEFVSELDYGVDALKNKKNSFPTINQSKESFVVPHEMLGTLLVKGKTNYLALKDEGQIKKAKEWLKDNGLEATLILDSGK